MPDDTSDIEIREADIDDLAAIFHLGEKVFTPGNTSNLYRTWDEYEVTGLFNSEPEYLLVADTGTRIVGFAMGTTIEKARSAWNYGHLLWLAVDPDFSKRGVGQMLFARFRALMEDAGVRMLMIDTQTDNEAAIAFFARQGFQNPTDHVYMTLYLQKET